MLKTFIMLFALAGSGPLVTTAARAETYFKGSQILAMCDTVGDESAAVGKRNICAFYLLGVSDGLVTSSLYGRAATDKSALKPVLCLPDGAGVAVLSEAFQAYGKAHAGRMDAGGGEAAAAALQARHGCGWLKAKNSKPDVVFLSAGDLLRKCTDANAVVGLYCLYYVLGASDLYAAMGDGRVKGVAAAGFASQICYPKTMADDEPKRTFLASMTAHPEAASDPAALTVARALHLAFPCK